MTAPYASVVDISHHNTVGGDGPALAGFQLVATSGIRGVIHKATQGSHFVDFRYAARREAAKKAGLLWGAYHFGDSSNAATQAAHFLAVAQPDKDTLIALDWEPNGEETMRIGQAREFLAWINEKLKRKAVLYSGNLAKEELGAAPDSFFGAHRLWLAQYRAFWKCQCSWQKPWLWQFSQHGSVPGISGDVDCNHYDGADLKREWAA